MPVTYDSSLDDDASKVRFYLNDTTEGSGPKPGGGNFTDAEITAVITLEGNWQKATASCFEVLASAWAKTADLTIGPRSESYSQIAARYEKTAATWRKQHGSGIRAAVAGSRSMGRDDGYEDYEA